MVVEFQVFGDVTLIVDGTVVEVGHARQRAVLAVLLVDANRPVPAGTLIDRVWSDQMPRHARTALAGYLSRLRRLGITIQRGPGGYALLTDTDTVDLHRFHRLTEQARAATDDALAARLFGQALRLWHGEPFATLDTPWLNSVRQALEADRLAAELDRNDVGLRRGEHVALLGDLARCAARYPFDERLAIQEMTALYRSGRSAAALERYTRLRTTLAEELGADPSPALQELFRVIMTGEQHRPHRRQQTIPRQLPAAPQAFTGRSAALARLDATAGRDHAAAVVISSVTGTAGVGKTALAVHWAHTVADRFPDGQLYVNLRGYDPDNPAMTPAEALRDLLDALGVPPERIPHGVDAQAALYRSLLADRRMLIVLDNAREANQVRPLLPAARRCVAVVTSRDQMPGLVVLNNAQPIEIDLLTDEEAVNLLEQRIGRHRVAAEPDAVRRLIERCARLPLALAIVAVRAMLTPAAPLAKLAAMLELDSFADEDAAIDIRAVFECSYRALDAAAAKLFRLLGAHWGADVSGAAAASLAGVTSTEVDAALALLVEASLIQERLPGRYMMHDLLRAYAKELAHRDPDARPAVARALDHYAHTAHHADLLVYPSRDPIEPPPASPSVTAERFTDRTAALSWFTAEHAVLVGTFTATPGRTMTGSDPAMWHLAWALSNVLNLQGHWRDQEHVQRGAVAAARRLDDPRREAHALRALGRVQDVLRQDVQADANLRQALELFERIGDREGAAQTHINLARMWQRQGELAAALSHDEASLRLYQASGSRAGQARALNNVGWGLARSGRYAEAHMRCQASIAMCRTVGNLHGEANATLSIASIHNELGQQAQATRDFAEAVRLFREAHDRPQEATCLTLLGDAYQTMGELQRARAAWKQAVVLLDELAVPAGDVRARLGRPPLPLGALKASRSHRPR